MASTPAPWDRAALTRVATDGRRVAEIVQLGPGTPDLATLFAFARDAELRFATLRLRLEERACISGGETLRVHEVLVRHPGVAAGDGRATGSARHHEPRDLAERWRDDPRLSRLAPTRHRTTRARTPRRPRRPRPAGSFAALPAPHGPARQLARGHLRPSRRLLPERAGDGVDGRDRDRHLGRPRGCLRHLRPSADDRDGRRPSGPSARRWPSTARPGCSRSSSSRSGAP